MRPDQAMIKSNKFVSHSQLGWWLREIRLNGLLMVPSKRSLRFETPSNIIRSVPETGDAAWN